MSERIQMACLRAVRLLANHYRTAPDKLTESQVREYFLFLKNEKLFASSSFKVASNGIKFFY